MIAGIFHEGSGLGNQLHRYVASKVLANDKGVNHCMAGTYFKGESFMDLDLGTGCPPWFESSAKRWNEKKVIENGVDIRSYDPEINFVEDNTIIDGEFQDPRYFEHRLNEVREWLKVEPLNMPDDLCIINFRGGEYTIYPDLFLPKEYWEAAMSYMPKGMRFEVHTDDVETAKRFFPDFECVHDIALNWRSIRYAKHLILSNSSFAILPALLNENLKEKPLAPRYWARHNTGVWALPQNYYRQFFYL